MSRPATPAGYFDDMWAHSSDPWEHGTRWYEARKYALTVACLPRQRYLRCFEPACGAGFLTALLADRCDEVVATERSARGAEATATRCAGLAQVHASQGRVPDDWPAGTFDLIVLSELLYYLDDPDLDAVLSHSVDALTAGGNVLVVHYRRPVPEHVRSGDEVHARARALLGEPLVTHVEEPFALEVFAP